MYPPAKAKFFRTLIIIWIAVVILAALVYGLFFSPLSPFHQCTLIGCRDTLELSLSHEPNVQYSILLTSQDGTTRNITCTPGSNTASGDATAICRTGIVTVYGFAPKSVNVEISWKGGNYTTYTSPSYAPFRPNGPFCLPECRLGRVFIQLP